MEKPDGVIEMALEEHETPEGTHWVLSLDVSGSQEELLDLGERLKKTLDEWLTAHGIVIAHGTGPDGCKYDSKPN